MKLKVINILTVIIFFKSGSGVRITPKLDFGTDTSPGVRTDLKFPRSDHRVTYQNTNSDNNVAITCTSGCNSTKLNDANGVSTDVVVHVQTNVNVPKVNNKEVVSEVPIIIGTNDNSQWNGNHPVYNNVPSVQTNYAPVIPPTYQQIPIYQNGVKPNYRWLQPQPQLTWYPKQKGVVNYHNPIEFKKIYTNTWPNLKFNTDYLNQYYVNLQKLNLNCFPQQNQPSIVNPYPSPSHIDDKIAPLNK